MNQLSLDSECGSDGETLTPELLRRLHSYAYRYLGNEASAQDAVQSTLEALIHGARNFRGDSAYTTFIFSILKHKISDEIRIQRRYEFNTDAAELRSDYLTNDQDAWEELTYPERRAYASRLLIALDAGLEKMSPQGRKVFMLTEFYGYAAAEISRDLGLQTGNVWVLLHRARKLLKDSLDKDGYSISEAMRTGKNPALLTSI